MLERGSYFELSRFIFLQPLKLIILRRLDETKKINIVRYIIILIYYSN